MNEIIEISADVMSGTAVFRGTRVPVRHLFDYLEDGSTIDEFLSDFPTVGRDLVVALLEELKNRALPGEKAAA